MRSASAVIASSGGGASSLRSVGGPSSAVVVVVLVSVSWLLSTTATRYTANPLSFVGAIGHESYRIATYDRRNIRK